MKFAVIGTFHQRHENTFPLMHRLFVDSTRTPDEAWIMCEAQEDRDAVFLAIQDLYEQELIDGFPAALNAIVTPTPRTDTGKYKVIPYSNKINAALNATSCDLVCYLDNNSMPGPDKYRVMAEAMEQHPEQAAVYCTQKRTGFSDVTHHARDIIEDGYCQVNFTQVMHRRTADRWTLDMAHANPDLADALFWRSLHRTLGPFYPAGGDTIHDDHHIPHPGLSS